MNASADRYRRLSHRFTEMIDAVPADRWDGSSPCERWTAFDIVEHVVTTEADFVARMGFDAPFLTAPNSTAEVLAAWPTVRDAVQAHLDDPAHADHQYDGWFGPTTVAATIDTFYSMDLAVHGWDLARSAGLDTFLEIPSDEIVAVRAALAMMGEAARTPGILGPELDVADDADEQTRLLAELGRRA